MRTSFLLLLVISIATAASAEVSQTVMAEADIVFTGQVTKPGPAAPAEVPEGTATVTVAVDRVITKPASLVLESGTLITMAIAGSAPEYPEGARATFYTAGWIYGDSLAVRELGHEADDVPHLAAAFAEDADTASKVADAKMTVLIDQADAVVVGRVVAVAPPTAPLVAAAAEAQSEGEPVSEHDPMWREATVQVENWMKGDVSSDRVAVRFPASIDVAWYAVPKLKVGMRGTFMLHGDTMSGRGPARSAAGAVRPTFAIISPTDVVPTVEAPRVRRLMSQ